MLFVVTIGEVSELAEGARLESVYRGNSVEGSNPSLSVEVPWESMGLFRFLDLYERAFDPI